MLNEGYLNIHGTRNLNLSPLIILFSKEVKIYVNYFNTRAILNMIHPRADMARKFLGVRYVW